MGKKKSKPSAPAHEPYSKMEDTPWTTQARRIADIGGSGVLNNYNKVNVFDAATRKTLDDRNNQTFKRAFDEMDRQYTNIMNRYTANNYNRFGTLNATRPQFITDEYKRDFQRQMDDMAYNKAAHYDELMDKELSRRYNTLNMFDDLYRYGQVPYQLDISNYNVDQTNKDLDYNRRMADYNLAAQSYLQGGGNNLWSTAIGALGKGIQGGINGYLSTGSPWGAAAGAAGGIGGAMI